jgi:DNA-binding Lrp family transcriptional regulator
MFYTGDWLKEPTLRASSLAARGLWMDMLCFMHESPRRGYMMLTPILPMKTAHIARAVGITEEECHELLKELYQNGVAAYEELETIGSCWYSRRMVRDEATRQKLSDAGKRGGRPRSEASTKPYTKGPKGSSVSVSPSPSISNQIQDRVIETVYTRIPWRARKQPAHTKVAIAESLTKLLDRHENVTATAEWLGDRLHDYYVSPEGRSEYFRNPSTFLNGDGFDEPDEVWSSRHKERTQM